MAGDLVIGLGTPGGLCFVVLTTSPAARGRDALRLSSGFQHRKEDGAVATTN